MKVASKTRATLGECPVWDERSQRLFWIDIEAGRLFAVTLEGLETYWQLPERIGSFGLTTSTDVIVIALETGFAVYDLQMERLNRIEMPAPLAQTVRFNDGKCDPYGNFWAGTMSEKSPKQPQAKLYRLSPELNVEIMREGIAVSNSLAWSSDQTSMYFADSPTKSIRKFEASNDADPLEDGALFIGPDAFKGVPDGSTVDVEHRLWTAEWDGWRIVVHDERGLFKQELSLPVQRPTSCCFGGPELTTLFITSASIDLSADELKAQPEAGMVLAIENAGRGVPADRFGLLQSV
jgi:L-arabinonolactonase